MLQRVSQVRHLGSHHARLKSSPPKSLAKRTYTAVHREKIVFGIDYGSHLAKLAVYDRHTARPSVLRNPEDGNVPYWLTAVAYDRRSSKLVSGKRAKEIAREDAGAAAIKLKKLLGTAPGHPQYDEWLRENDPSVVTVVPRAEWTDTEKGEARDLEKANKVVVGLNSVAGQHWSAAELASTTFASMRTVMQAYQATHGSAAEALPEAYLVIPPDFDDSQRATIVLAARKAGIKVLKLIEEPIAALYGIRRLENFGWYSVSDFGDTLKHYLIRVFDGEPDLYEASYVEIPDLLPKAETQFFDYLASKVPRTTKTMHPQWRNDLVKLFDASKDFLLDEPEYQLPQSHYLSRKIPHISREARALASFYSIRDSRFGRKILDSIEKVLPEDTVVQPILIGGHSLAYPEISHEMERTFKSRLGDTVSDPTSTLAIGAALKAAADNGFAHTILRGRESSSWGHPILAHTYVDTIHHHLHLSKHHVPLPSTLNFSTLATYSNIEPLLPAFHEEQLFPENVNKPYPAISYALLRDPFSGELEHWARLSLQTPYTPAEPVTMEERTLEKAPKIYRQFVQIDPMPQWLQREMLLDGEPSLDEVQPDLSLCFILNLTASPLYDTSRNLPDLSQDDLVEDRMVRIVDESVHPDFRKVIQANPDKPHWATRTMMHAEDSPQEAAYEAQETFVGLLSDIQAQKDSHSGFYRIQNRAHDLLQHIMGHLRPNDYHSVIATGGMAPRPLSPPSPTTPRHGSASCLSPFHKIKDDKNLEALTAVTTADISGRAASKYVDAITMAHEQFMAHIEALGVDMRSDLEKGLAEMQAVVERDFGPEGKPKKLPLVVHTDDRDELPSLPGGPDPDGEPANWQYPGITSDLLKQYYTLYKILEFELSEEGNKAIEQMYSEMKSDERAVDDLGTPFTSLSAYLDSFEDPEHNLMSPVSEEEERANRMAHLKFLQEIIGRMNARKKLKHFYGHQHRAVMITDSAPDATELKEIEAALTRAARDNVSFTFLSIDGTPFDGPFMQMVARVKGCKTIRLYREYLWSDEFLKQYGGTAWHDRFQEPALRNLAVRVDFPGYTIDKVYGGWMTPEDKARLEKQPNTSTIRFKVGSLEPSYDIIPGPTARRPDPTAMLVKLKPKEGFNDEKRASDPDWMYNPDSKPETKGLSTEVRLKPSAHTPVSWEIGWNDGSGKKHSSTHTLRLSDFSAPVGYSDEPGITKLVRNAKFVELMRKVLHAPLQSRLSSIESDTPVFEMDNEVLGIKFIGQKQENELVRIYDVDAKHSVVRLLNERLLDPNYKDGPIPSQYHNLVRVAAHLLDMWRHKYGLGDQNERGSRYDQDDIVSRLFESYMKASNIKPVSLYARWKSLFGTIGEGINVAQLEDPNYEPLNQDSALTLASFRDETKRFPVPEPQYTPKFHNLLYLPEHTAPVLDVRNAYISANMFNKLEFFERIDLVPMDAYNLWVQSSLIETFHGSWDLPIEDMPITKAITTPDPLTIVADDIGFGFPHLQETIQATVGPHWPQWEKRLNEHAEWREAVRRNPKLANWQERLLGRTQRPPLGRQFVDLLSKAHDDDQFIGMLNMMVDDARNFDYRIEKSAILDPRLRPIPEVRQYYLDTVAPHSSPEEIDRALRVFKKLERRHRKEDAKTMREEEMFDSWYVLLKKEQARPSNAQAHLLSLLERVKKADLDQATKNQALEEVTSLEQKIIDSDSVLLKHLLDNPSVLSNMSQNIGPSTSDDDILAELQKHVPLDLLDRELSQVQRVVVAERPVDPADLDELRMRGSEEDAWRSAQLEVQDKVLMKDSGNDSVNDLYRKLLPAAVSRFTLFDESVHSDLPLEVELGNIPIDWDDRLSRLKRKARAVVRSRLFREIDMKQETRHRLRSHLMKVSQSNVDHQLFLFNLDRQLGELELQRSDLPYNDPEEFERRMKELQMDITADDYAMLVNFEYMRNAEANSVRWLSEAYGWRGLIPFMPQASRALADFLERHQLMSQSHAMAHRDPFQYWFDGKMPGFDFSTTELKFFGKILTPAEAKRRTVYERQLAKKQKAAASATSDVLVTPEEGGLTVGTGDLSTAPTPAEPTTPSQDIPPEPASDAAPHEASTEAVQESAESGAAQADTETPVVDKSAAESGEVETPEAKPEPEIVYTEWEEISDPYQRSDFNSDLEWHIYQTQLKQGTAPRDPEELAAKQAEVSFRVLDFLNADGSIDWNFVKTRRLQYPMLPAGGDVHVYDNSTYDNRDNTGREMKATDLDERELTKLELEALSGLDLDKEDSDFEIFKILRNIRVKHAEEARRVAKEEQEQREFDKFRVPDENAGYNPFRDGWDRNKYEDQLYMERQQQRETELLIKSDEYKQEREDEMAWHDEKLAHSIEYIMNMPGHYIKGRTEQWVRVDQIRRELSYEAPMKDDDLVEQGNWEKWLAQDERTYRGHPYEEDTLYLRLFGFHIPFWRVSQASKPILDRTLWPKPLLTWMGNPSSPLDEFEPPFEPIVTTLRHPSPLKPEGKTPAEEREEKAFKQLQRYPFDRYKHAVRKAYEKYHGLSHNRSSLQQRLQQSADNYKLSQELAQVGSFDPIVEPVSTARVQVDLNSPQEKSAEAARLVRLGLQKIAGESSSASTSSTSASPSSSLGEFVHSEPQSSTLPVPRNIRERWEWAKQAALDEMVRDHSIQLEKENFLSWVEAQKKELAKMPEEDAKDKKSDKKSTPNLASIPIVKYPTYAPVSEQSGLLSLPGGVVSKIVSKLAAEKKEHEKHARRELSADLQKAYRNLTADVQHVNQYLKELHGPYETLVRRRLHRQKVIALPDNVRALAAPLEGIGEESNDDILHPIDLDLLEQVERESKILGVDPNFWNRHDSKSKRQQKMLSRMLTTMSPERLEKYESEMDQIHLRRMDLAEQVDKRKAEIAKKIGVNEMRYTYGPVVMQDLKRTSFLRNIFHPRPDDQVAGLADLDLRAEHPTHSWGMDSMDISHMEDMMHKTYPSAYQRLAAHVTEALKAERRAAGIPEDGGADEFDEHGGGHH